MKRTKKYIWLSLAIITGFLVSLIILHFCLSFFIENMNVNMETEQDTVLNLMTTSQKISITNLALMIWPDQYQSETEFIIQSTANKNSIYSIDGSILTKDKSDVESAKQN